MKLRRVIWKDIKGFEGLYRISSSGKVFSIRSNRILKTKINVSHGYSEIELNVNGKPYYYRINRLVAIAFLPNPKNLPLVNHKNGKKQDNHYSNLEWCTHSYNNTHAIANGLSTTYNMRMYHLLTNGIETIRVESQDELIKLTGYVSKNTLTKYSQNGEPLRRGKYKGYTIKSQRT